MNYHDSLKRIENTIRITLSSLFKSPKRGIRRLLVRGLKYHIIRRSKKEEKKLGLEVQIRNYGQFDIYLQHRVWCECNFCLAISSSFFFR